MSSDADKPGIRVREILLDSVPNAARVLLARFIGWSPDDVEEDPVRALKSVLNMLRASTDDPSESDQAVVKAMKWLLNDVPMDDPDREDLEASIGTLEKRA